MAYRWIHKVGLAVVNEGKLLVVRKRGTEMFILPGGKLENGEGDLQALAREIEEELGCSFKNPYLRGVFKDNAAEMSNSIVVISLYSAELIGEPHAQSEIEEIAWAEIKRSRDLALAPSIVNRILPFLKKRERTVKNSVGQVSQEATQGFFEIV